MADHLDAPGLKSPNMDAEIDTDADAVAEIAFRITFSPKVKGKQTARVRRATGAEAAGNSSGGQLIIKDTPVNFDSSITIMESGPYKFYAGLRSDPFFFDLLGFLNGFKFTGSDFFIDKNVFSMVLEVPNTALGANPKIGIWVRGGLRSTRCSTMGTPRTPSTASHPPRTGRSSRPVLWRRWSHLGTTPARRRRSRSFCSRIS